MQETAEFQNVLVSNRKNLTPKDSMQKLINYALLEDAKSRSRFQKNVRANWILPLLIFTYPCYYITKGILNGCWSSLHPDMSFQFTFAQVGRPFRLTYRPELYLKDKSAELYHQEQINLEKEKQGVQLTNSPVVLWH